ncbi:MAG: helix-turn-helix transcriptional regulator [bacterium]
MNYLGKYLKKKLKELKVSEREISAKCGISHSYLNQLIKGISPSTKKNISPTLITFEKLSKGLDVSVEFLQRIARGIIQEDEYFTEEKNIVSDKFLNSENKNISPDLLKQIGDFQNFISIVGLDNKTRSENEWSELIYELKFLIGKHLQEKK